jgi:hypothetical protein
MTFSSVRFATITRESEGETRSAGVGFLGWSWTWTSCKFAEKSNICYRIALRRLPMSIAKPREVVPTPKLKAEINASLEAAVAEAERGGYVSLEEAERRADLLLKKLLVEHPEIDR